MPKSSQKLADQRKELPDAPGVYVFRNRAGDALYVGKANSIRKRVASHFAGKGGGRGSGMGGTAELIDRTDSIEFLVTENEPRGAARRAELHQALPAAVQHPAAGRQVLSVRRRQPRRGVPARLLHPRAAPAEPRLLRPVLERQAGPRDTRPARQALPVPDLRGAGARAALGRPVPRLLHQALPGALRRLHRQGGVPGQHRPDRRLPLRPLQGDRRRPRGEDGGGLRGPGLRAGGALPRPPQRGPLDDGAPAGRRRLARQRRPDRGGGGGRATRTRRSSRSATACSPSGRASTWRARTRRRGTIATRARSPRPSCSSTTARRRRFPAG